MRRGLDGIYLLFGLRAVFKPRRGLVPLDFGGHSEGETPLPIPNRAVKPLSADGTWWATAWESRSPPVFPSRAAFGRLFFVRLRRVAVDRGAEVRSRRACARKAPFAVVACRRPARGFAGCPTGAAGGPRRRLPSGPAIGSGMPVGPSASGPLRAQRLKPVFAKRGEVDHEVDTVDNSLAKVVAPVEHGAQSTNGLGRNVCSARDFARDPDGLLKTA